MQFNFDDKVSFVGGTLFSIIPNIPPDDLIVTIVMAFVGALTSFMASLILRWVLKKLSFNKKGKQKQG